MRWRHFKVDVCLMNCSVWRRASSILSDDMDGEML